MPLAQAPPEPAKPAETELRNPRDSDDSELVSPAGIVPSVYDAPTLVGASAGSDINRTGEAATVSAVASPLGARAHELGRDEAPEVAPSGESRRDAQARAAIRSALDVLLEATTGNGVTTSTWEPDWAAMNELRDRTLGVDATGPSHNAALRPLEPAHKSLHYSTTEQPLSENRFKTASDRLAEANPSSRLMAQRVTQARDVLRVGRQARKGDAAPPTRILSAFLARAALSAALGCETDAPPYAQYDSSDASATSTDSGRVAAAMHAIGSGDHAAPFRGRMGEASVAQPTSTDPVIRHAYLRQLAQSTAQEPAAPKPHAMDAQAMFLASPLAPDGKSDEASKRRLQTEAARIRREVEAHPTRPSDAPPPPLGKVDGVEMARRHLACSSACDHCATGDCRIFEVAALAALGPVVCYPGRRPAAPKGDAAVAVETYPLLPEEKEKQEEEITKLLAAGVIEACAAPALVSPTFFAYRHRYVDSEEAAAAWWAPSASPEALQQHLDEEINAVLSCASAEDDGGITLGPVSSTRIQRALAARALTDAGRLVYDYGTLNDAGCGWPMAMCTASEMLTFIQPGSWVASVDVKSGFHHVQMQPADRSLMAFASNSTGTLYQPARLMFGLRQAPAHFSTVTAEVVQTAQREIWAALGRDCGVKLAVYIDDIFVFAPSQELCARALQILSDYCIAVGVKLKDEKQRDPSQDSPLLGLRVDTQRMEMYIPADKRYNMLFLTHLVLRCAERRQPVPVSIMRKLTGKLVHFLSVFPEGLVHMAPLWDVCEARAGGACNVHDSAVATQSLRFFHAALASGDAGATKCVPAPTSPTASPWVVSFSDAAGDVGFGITMGPLVLHGLWRDELVEGTSIGMKELYPLVLLAHLAGKMLAPFTWSPKTDNLPNVFGMLKGHTDDKDAKPWLAALLAIQSALAYLVIPGWCPRQLNQFMDEVSKAPTVAEVEEAVARFAALASRARS